MNQVVERALPLHPIERVINHNQNFNSPLSVAFVAHAIRYYQQAVQQMPQDQREQMNNGFISYDAWAAVGDALVDGFNEIGM
ncbi:hypothetical protein [Limnobacter sp. P1]|uniref:hypothetical protein n=1 Tax=Limnobacter olei TaxID=3031298 RepID=UPI0023B16365|nr:hypothetical protein [Limnobacter sp. P1]